MGFYVLPTVTQPLVRGHEYEPIISPAKIADGKNAHNSLDIKDKGPLAQSVEHLTFNQVVAGSIPARPTNNHNKYK